MTAIEFFNTTNNITPHAVEYIVGFEGVEKKLEIQFRNTLSLPDGLRTIPRERWDEILTLVNCKILSYARNDYFDCYVLSESSLFVYPFKVILKTCGTTSLLRCLERLLATAKEFVPDTEVEFAYFARRNFLYPHRQLPPHTSFDEEIEYMNRIFGRQGEAFVFGPRTAHHWHLYVVDFTDRDEVTSDVTLEIMMTDLDRSVMEQFYRRPDFASHKDVTKSSGIANLVPGALTDEWQFEPCGYSMNGMLNDSYFTIHITPEPHCSYVSFETNISLPDYTKLIRDVVSLFKPGRFTVSLFADSGALCGPSSFNAFNRELGNYAFKANTYHEFEGQYNVTVCNYISRSLMLTSSPTNS